MSVPKSRRTQARTEYVWQATLLASEAGAVCSRLPKRWAFTRTRYILDAANRVMEEAVRRRERLRRPEGRAALPEGPPVLYSVG